MCRLKIPIDGDTNTLRSLDTLFTLLSEGRCGGWWHTKSAFTNVKIDLTTDFATTAVSITKQEKAIYLWTHSTKTINNSFALYFFLCMRLPCVFLYIHVFSKSPKNPAHIFHLLSVLCDKIWKLYIVNVQRVFMSKQTPSTYVVEWKRACHFDCACIISIPCPLLLQYCSFTALLLKSSYFKLDFKSFWQ